MDRDYSRLAQLSAKQDSAATVIDDIFKDGSVNYQIPISVIQGPENKQMEGCTALHILVQNSDVKNIQKLLDHGADFTIQNSIGETALHQAIYKRNFSKESTDNDSLDSIINAILNAHVQLNVFQNPCDQNGMSHFHAACMVNHEAAVTLFLKKNACLNQAVNSNSPYIPGYTPLHLATEYYGLEVLKILLIQGADMSLTDAYGWNPMYLLLNVRIGLWLERDESYLNDYDEQHFRKTGEMIKLVLTYYENGKNELFYDTGLLYIHVLCTLQDVSLVEQFLSSNDVNLAHSVKPDSVMWPGYTALHFAALFSIDTVTLLLKHRANFEAKNTDGETPFDFCKKTFKTGHIRAIIESHPVWNSIIMTDGKTSLLELVDAMKSENALEIFAQKIDINAHIPISSSLWPGYTPLHVAIEFNESDDYALYIERIRILLNAGASVTAKDSHGSTPIHVALYLYKYAVVYLLLHTNQSLFDLVDNYEVSLLQIACAAGIMNAARMIVQSRNFKINLPLISNYEFKQMNGVGVTSYFFTAGSTPLHIAVITKDVAMTRLLIEYGADILAQDSKGLTPIHRLVSLDCCPDLATIGRILLSVDYLVDVVTSFGLSHLHVACWVNHKPAVEKLLDQGVNIDIKLSDVTDLVSSDESDKQLEFLSAYAYCTPIGFAYCRKKSNVMDLLFQRCQHFTDIPKNVLNASRYTTKFNCFSSFEKAHLASLLFWDLQYGVKPIHVACYLFDVKAVKKLLEEGTNPNARVTSSSILWFNLTPLHLLFDLPFREDKKRYDIIKLLIDYGPDGMTPIHRSVKTNKFLGHDILMLLLNGQKNFNINPGPDIQQISHFHLACVCNSASIVEEFLKHGIDVNQTIDPADPLFGDFTALHVAARLNAKDTVDVLLKYGADVNARNPFGYTPLHCSVKANVTENPIISKYIMISLIGAGADIDALNNNSETPLELLMSVHKPTSEQLRILSRNQRCVNFFNFQNSVGFIAMAIKRLTNIKDIRENSVYQAVIISRSINKMDEHGQTPIHNIVSIRKISAPTKVYTKAIEGFLNVGIDIDQQNKNGETALDLAVNFGNSKAVAALLTIGANINLLCDGETPFYFQWQNVSKNFKESSDITRLLEKDQQIIKLFAKQVYKLQLINFDVMEMDKTIGDELQKQGCVDSKVVEQCQVELERMKTKTIGRSNISWWSFLSETGIIAAFPYVKKIERQMICDVFERQSFRFHKEFPEFSGILYMQYRKALTRMALIEASRDALSWLLNYNLSELCNDKILRFLTNEDLVIMIDAKDNPTTHVHKRRKIVEDNTQ